MCSDTLCGTHSLSSEHIPPVFLGRGYLIGNVINVTNGPSTKRHLLTGGHILDDASVRWSELLQIIWKKCQNSTGLVRLIPKFDFEGDRRSFGFTEFVISSALSAPRRAREAFHRMRPHPRMEVSTTFHKRRFQEAYDCLTVSLLSLGAGVLASYLYKVLDQDPCVCAVFTSGLVGN